MDQPEKLMRALEIVDEAYAEERERERRLEEARRAARASGGHHFVSRKR